jgi:hypothetical protein
MKNNYKLNKKLKTVMENTKQLLEISTDNINKAAEIINDFATSNDLKINGVIDSNISGAEYPSIKSKKRFRHSLNRVINHPTMKNCNLFLHYLAKYSKGTTAKLEYSEKEKSIIEARKKWKEAKEIALKLLVEYKELKGDYYLKNKQKKGLSI